jgi:glycosyltransferase involved in cell wall biosynthesis
MLTIAYSTREHKPEFIEYLKKSSGFKKIEVIEKINNGEKSLSEVYNEILSESKTDIVVFCHDDIYFDTTAWYHKLMKHFEKSDFGIIGMAGTTFMPKSGQWWENRNKMIGIVNHEHEGKKWSSKYSEDLNNKIKQTVIVDGVFIAVNKTKIKHKFNEEFKGFHFYDIPFCFENHIDGVKVGVITNIRITHKSIGMTNQQWEDNRKLFSEKYENNLPSKIPFDKEQRIKVLISCLFFKNFTGSELYVYELAKNLIKNNCDVTVLSEIGGPLTDMAKKLGIKVFSHREPPGFKLGDGKWAMTGPQGPEISKENVLYKVSEVKYDIVHIQHKPVAERILQLYPDINKIYSVHSEVIDLENPIKHESIKKYIAIRPEIKNHIVENFDIPEELVEVIYNPIDNEKFKSNSNVEEEYVLFVGTIDYLRENAIRDLVLKTESRGLQLLLVGENKSNYLEDILKNSHVKHIPATWNVEQYVNKCKETAGIQLGRTTIEGWMCNKPGWIYKVDFEGDIIDITKHEPPTDIEKYYAQNVASQIKNEYIKILS